MLTAALVALPHHIGAHTCFHQANFPKEKIFTKDDLFEK
jgi:hypothetical protein